MLLSLENLTFGYQGEQLLTEIKFTLNEGDRVGLVGGNGEGKTTLIRLMLGELSPDQGTIFRKNGLKIGYLAQNGGYESHNTVFEEMCSIFDEDKKAISSLRELEEKFSALTENSPEYKALSAKYESLNKRIAARDSYNFEVRVRTVLNGMGFSSSYGQVISTMSGGEKTRLKLCRLLLEEPELLILDEPTNHLDVKTLFWLEDYLASYKGSIFLVSHDRYFLDKIAREIYELENKKLSTFKGNYTKYKLLKAEKTARLMKEYEKQQEEISKLQEYVDKNLVRASTTKSAQSRRNKLEKMELIEKPKPPQTPPVFRFTYQEPSYEQALLIENLDLSAGEKSLIKDLSLSLKRGEKCAVVGDNGTGKSTLLRKIIEDKNPSIKKGRFVKYAFYDQENANLDGENTVLRELWDRHPLYDQTKVRSILAQVKLTAEDMEKRVRQLSGGERAKLALAVFECEQGNTLILDEPTNHLDLPARESLEEALKSFDGTILFVSHDRYFIQAIADKILELEDGKSALFKGTYEEYTAQKRALAATLLQEKQAPAPVLSKKEQSPAPVYKSKEERKNETKRRIRTQQIEGEISALEEEEAILNERLADQSVSGDFTKLKEVCDRLSEIKEKLDSLYEEYETLI